MPEFTLTLELRVIAKTSADAVDLGISAAEHLLDTFNDNKTIHPTVRIDACPVERKD